MWTETFASDQPKKENRILAAFALIKLWKTQAKAVKVFNDFAALIALRQLNLTNSK